MSKNSKWWDKSWNPVIGCSKTSEGCLNCYAEIMAKRFYPEPFSQIQCLEERLNLPLHWRKPQRIFVCNMSDLFHIAVPFEFIDSVFNIIEQCPQHTFLILTKRPKQMAQYFSAWQDYPYPENVHLGITCENQKRADERIPLLLQIPAAKRFVSFEPLLEEIDFTKVKPDEHFVGEIYEKIDQVIIGCENINGKAGRFDGMMLDTPENETYFYAALENIIDQCDSAGVKVFIKAIPINGRVSHNPAEWTKKFQKREMI